MAHTAGIFIWMWSAVDKALDHLSVAVERVSKGMNEQFGGDYILFLFLFYTASQLFGNQAYTLSNKVA